MIGRAVALTGVGSLLQIIFRSGGKREESVGCGREGGREGGREKCKGRQRLCKTVQTMLIVLHRLMQKTSHAHSSRGELQTKSRIGMLTSVSIRA